MAIFVSEYTDLAHTMPERRALREAIRNRLRPITMTTFARHPDARPARVGHRPGISVQQPLAIAIIAGLLLQFPLVVLAPPVLIGLTLSGERQTSS
jgi:multidrug efflux pump subunit AcrB